MQGTWFFEDWAVNGWSVSPGHRQAMLADAADGIVVGCYYDPVTQYYYAIQMFFSSELANQYKNSLASQSADPADAVAVQTVEPVTEQPVVTAARQKPPSSLLIRPRTSLPPYLQMKSPPPRRPQKPKKSLNNIHS